MPSKDIVWNPRKPARFNISLQELRQQGQLGQAALQSVGTVNTFFTLISAAERCGLSGRQQVQLAEMLEREPENAALQLSLRLLKEHVPAFTVEVGLRLSKTQQRNVDFANYVNNGLQRGRWIWAGKPSVNRAMSKENGLTWNERRTLGIENLSTSGRHNAYRKGNALLCKHPSLKTC